MANTFPTTKVPMMSLKFDNTYAVNSTPKWKTLIIGHKNKELETPLNKTFLVTSSKEAEDLFGKGSLLEEQITAYKANDMNIETWAIAIEEPKSMGTMSLTPVLDTEPADGIKGQISIYLDSLSIKIDFDSTKKGTDSSQIYLYKVLNDAINNNLNSKLTSELVLDSKKSITSIILKTKQLYNKISSLSFKCDGLPQGIKQIQASDFKPGDTLLPKVSDVFDTIKDNRYNAFVCPFSDAENLKVLSDKLRERWEPTLQNDGFAFVFINKELNDASDYCNKELNSQNIAMINTLNFPDAGHKINAALAAQCCAVAYSDPALPLTTMILSGIRAPDEEHQFSWQERSNLLDSGISTLKIIGPDVVVERVITTYKTTNGIKDESYLNAETVFTLSYIREYFRNRFWGKYGQFKLGDDGAVIQPGQRILTPKTAKAELISIYKELEDMGYVENGDLFVKNLSVERDKINRSMIHMVLPPTVIGQLFQVQALIQFRK